MLVRSFFLFVLVAGLALATSAEAQPVTLPQIMQHPDWIGRAPEDGYWSDDSSEIIYSRKREGSEVRDRFVVDRRGRTTVEVSPDRIPELSVDGGDVSRDGRRKVYAREGDLYLKDVRSGRIEQLTRTQDRERSPRFLRGDDAIQFRRGDVLLVRDLKTGLEWQPADLRTEDDPDEETEDEPSYLEQQQKDLFGIVRLWEKNEQDREAHDDLLRAQDPYRAPEPWYLGSKKEIRGTTFSPNGRWLLVRLVPAKADRGQRDVMPNYVSDDGYVTTEEVRPKVGTGDVVGEEFLLLDLTSRQQYELDLGSLPDITVDRLADIRARTQAWRAERTGSSDDADEKADDEKEKKEEDPKPRAVSMFGSEWHADGDQILLQLFSEDNKDRWIVRVDAPTQTVHSEHHLHDPAWINWRYNEFGWIPRSDRLFYLSEETGTSRLYVKEAGGDATAWTDDGATVAGVESDREGKWLYFRSNRPHPGVYEIYRASTRNGNVEQVTNLGGVNQATLSPDGKRLLVRHSEIDRHEELIVVEAKSGGRATPVTDTVSAAFAAQDWVIPQIVEVPGSHGRPIYSKFYPPAAGTPPGGPAVIFVHGAGYTQNAHFGWAYYFREFMFHTLLSQHGYAVLDMDYRASAGYGRDWRTAIYRQMGTPELDDLQDGIDWLAQNHGIDPERVGVYGGSYGGFITLMALFTRPDMFQCGAALRPVTDWAHYNHGYTSNILNTPTVDHESFYRSSPIEHAEGLTKPLLMCHGMQDDNVVFQDTVRLAQRLIELEKEDWEVALYPIEPHGFRQPSSWLDEYRRIFKLMETHLK